MTRQAFPTRHSLNDTLAALEGAFDETFASPSTDYGRLKDLIERLTHIVTCQVCELAYHLEPPESGRVERLQRLAAQACSRLEKATAQQHRAKLPYFENLSRQVIAEGEAAGLGPGSRVLMVGCGAFPVTAWALEETFGCEIVALDSDPEALQLAHQSSAGRPRLKFLQGQGEQVEAYDFSHIVVASLVDRKRQVLENLGRRSRLGTVLLVRFGNHLRRVFNYELDKLPSCWKARRLIRGDEEVYETLICRRARCFGRVLLVGAGPVAAVTGLALRRQGVETVEMVTRPSPSGQELAQQLNRGGLRCRAAHPGLGLQGEFCPDALYLDYAKMSGSFDTVFLALPAHAYQEAVEALVKVGVIKPNTLVVLCSAGLGSGKRLERWFEQTVGAITVASFSNFFAAAKSLGGPTDVVIKAVKKKVTVGGREKEARQLLRQMLEPMGVQVEGVESTLTAESRNITLYVHPPLCINRYALERVFSAAKTPRFLYKIFPEGPITLQTMETMASLFIEVSTVLEKVGVPPFELLPFLNNENYPVPEDYLPASTIEGYSEASLREKAMLLFIRYAGLLVDPHSEPDDDGRFFDFSAVVLPQGSPSAPPRIPTEDYFSLLVVEGLAQRLQQPVPTLNRLTRLFEEYASLDPALIESQRQTGADLL